MEALGGGGEVKIGHSLHLARLQGEGVGLEATGVLDRGLVDLKISDKLAGRL
jgi:hypothetical protein